MKVHIYNYDGYTFIDDHDNLEIVDRANLGSIKNLTEMLDENKIKFASANKSRLRAVQANEIKDSLKTFIEAPLKLTKPVIGAEGLAFYITYSVYRKKTADEIIECVKAILDLLWDYGIEKYWDPSEPNSLIRTPEMIAKNPNPKYHFVYDNVQNWLINYFREKGFDVKSKAEQALENLPI